MSTRAASAASRLRFRHRAVGLAGALLLGAVAARAGSTSPSAGRAVLVMANGSRLEVARAWQVGSSYHVELANGGALIIPASQVKRVSNDSADLPGAHANPVVARSTPGAGSGEGGGASAVASGEEYSSRREAVAAMRAAGASPPEVSVARGIRPTGVMPHAGAGGPVGDSRITPGMMSGILTRQAPRSSSDMSRPAPGGLHGAISPLSGSPATPAPNGLGKPN